MIQNKSEKLSSISDNSSIIWAELDFEAKTGMQPRHGVYSSYLYNVCVRVCLCVCVLTDGVAQSVHQALGVC